MSDMNGTGMVNPPNNEPSGAVTSDKPAKKKPVQGTFRSGIQKKPAIKVDTNKHGIRRETVIGQQNTKRTGRKKV
jgi:hypothetical protein